MKKKIMNYLGFKETKIIIFFMILSCSLISSCTTTRHANFSDPKDNSVRIFTTKIPTESYQEVAFIEVFGSIYASKQRLTHRLKLRAEQLGCDAVINVKYKYSFIYPVVTGTAIKTN